MPLLLTLGQHADAGPVARVGCVYERQEGLQWRSGSSMFEATLC